MQRFRYRQFLLLLALILPSVAVAILGWITLLRESEDTGGKATAAIVQSIRGTLESIKVGALGDSPSWMREHPEVILVASVTPPGGLDVLAWNSPPGDDGAAELNSLISDLRSNFESLHLSEHEWKPYGNGYWLSKTPVPRGSTQPLVIAVRADDIVQQVRNEREERGNKILFEIGSMDPAAAAEKAEPGETDAIRFHGDLGFGGEIAITSIEAGGSVIRALGAEFPGMGVKIGQDPAGSQQFFAIALGVVLFLTLIGWYLLFRDSLRESRIAEMRSQFVASVSHELKTPLTGIRMSAETLQMRDSLDPQVHAEFLATIVNQSERLTRLLNNVLDFSRIERGQRTYLLEPVSLADVVQSAARAMQVQVAEQGFDFHVEVGNGIPPRMSLDKDALEQAIINLLTNALKYSGKSRTITLKLSSMDGYAVIQVMDHGIGIARKEFKRIFKTFYRVASPENRAISGTGLGLALIAHIAKGHGGTVEVESTPGVGSTFSIRIPFQGEALA